MAAFGPWVGEEDKEGGDGGGGQEALDGVGAFDAQEAHIGEVGALKLAVDATDAGEEPVDTEEIALGLFGGAGGEEAPLAAAEFDVERAVGVGKEILQAQDIGPAGGRKDGAGRQGQVHRPNKRAKKPPPPPLSTRSMRA